MPVFRHKPVQRRPRPKIALLAQQGGATISVDDTVARFTGTPANGSPITSSSFTPPNNSLLVVPVSGDTSGVGGATSDITVSVSGGSLTWTNRAERDTGDAGGNRGHVSIFTAEVATGASMTVGVTRTAGDGGTNRLSAKVYIVTGYNVGDPVGAVGEGSTTATSNTPNAYTSTVDGSRGFGAATDWGQNGNLSSSDVEDVADYAGQIAVISLYKASNTSPSGSTVTINFVTDGGASSEWNWVALEVKPGAGGAGNSISPTATITPAASLALSASRNRAYTATVTPTGALANAITRIRAYTATITPTAALIALRLLIRAYTATITPTGALTSIKAALKSFTATITPAAVLTKAASILRAYTATITPAATLARVASFVKALTATITPAGLLAKAASRLRAYTATITPTGALSAFKVIVRTFTATITPTATFLKISVKSFVGSITPAGALIKTAAFVKSFTATITPAGALFKTIYKFFTATISAIGAALVGLFGVADRVSVAVGDYQVTGAMVRDGIKTIAATGNGLKTYVITSDEAAS